MDKKGAGLKQPVMITIAEMPPKLTFDIKTEQNALLGNKHRFDIHIDKAKGISLELLKLSIENVADESVKMQNVPLNHANTDNMDSINMLQS